jgi:hypothetical protein
MCTDFSAEHADIAVGDPWLRGPDGKFLYPDGRTTVLTRTKIADDLIDAAVADGYLNVREIPLKTYMMNFEKSARYKRNFVPANLLIRRKLGLAVPNFHQDLPAPSAKACANAAVKLVVGYMARYKWFRRIGLRLAQTKPALAYFRWNRRRKEEGFSEAYKRQERFVAPIMPPKSRSTRETSGFEVV